MDAGHLKESTAEGLRRGSAVSGDVSCVTQSDVSTELQCRNSCAQNKLVALQELGELCQKELVKIPELSCLKLLLTFMGNVWKISNTGKTKPCVQGLQCFG